MSHKEKAFGSSAQDPLKSNRYIQQMISELSFFNDIDSYDEIERGMALQNLMDSLGLLYLEYFQFHLEEAMAFGSAQEPLLRLAARHIDEDYISLLRDLTLRLDEPELWERACWDRTRVEAFNAMFGEIVGRLDLEFVERRMQRAKHNFSVEDHRVPRNAPKSHWWWFSHFGE